MPPTTSRRPVSSGRPGEPPSSRVPPQEYPDDEIPFRDEPSFTGEIPHEDLSRTVADFLYRHVVARKDIGVSSLGGASNGKGTVLEVEAKLGRFIDRDRRTRFKLPVATETVFVKELTGAHLQFESYMTLVRCTLIFPSRGL